MTDDGGVLGNLPHSRPGKRSEKRDAGAARSAARPKKASAARGKRTAAVKKPGSGDRVVVEHDMGAQVRHDPVPPPATEDPVGAVVRTATGVAVTGVRVAGALSRELFKLLPRP